MKNEKLKKIREDFAVGLISYSIASKLFQHYLDQWEIVNQIWSRSFDLLKESTFKIHYSKICSDLSFQYNEICDFLLEVMKVLPYETN